MMDCPKCGKQMYELRSAVEDKPILYGCMTTGCIREWMQEMKSTPSVYVVGNIVHAQYYSDKLGRMRHFTHDGDTWTEQADDDRWRVGLYDV